MQQIYNTPVALVLGPDSFVGVGAEKKKNHPPVFCGRLAICHRLRNTEEGKNDTKSNTNGAIHHPWP